MDEIAFYLGIGVVIALAGLLTGLLKHTRASKSKLNALKEEISKLGAMKEDITALMSQMNSLRNRHSDQKEHIAQLQEQVASLEDKISHYTPPEDILSQFTMDLKYGFHRDNTVLGKPYCSKCLLQKKKAFPLQDEGGEWKCPECGEHYLQKK